MARCIVRRLMGELGLKGPVRGRTARTTFGKVAEASSAARANRGLQASAQTHCGYPTCPMQRPSEVLRTWLWSSTPSCAVWSEGAYRGRPDSPRKRLGIFSGLRIERKSRGTSCEWSMPPPSASPLAGQSAMFDSLFTD